MTQSPTTDPVFLTDTVTAVSRDPSVAMATLADDALTTKDEYDRPNPNGTTALPV